MRGFTDFDPELAGALDELVEMGRDDPCLGGNAAPVEARAAELILLDHGGLEAELRGSDRRHVASGAGADDDDLIAGFAHGDAFQGSRENVGL
jgi:hypothetical protein